MLSVILGVNSKWRMEFSLVAIYMARMKNENIPQKEKRTTFGCKRSISLWSRDSKNA